MKRNWGTKCLNTRFLIVSPRIVSFIISHSLAFLLEKFFKSPFFTWSDGRFFCGVEVQTKKLHPEGLLVNNKTVWINCLDSRQVLQIWPFLPNISVGFVPPDVKNVACFLIWVSAKSPAFQSSKHTFLQRFSVKFSSEQSQSLIGKASLAWKVN